MSFEGDHTLTPAGWWRSCNWEGTTKFWKKGKESVFLVTLFKTFMNLFENLPSRNYPEEGIIYRYMCGAIIKNFCHLTSLREFNVEISLAFRHAERPGIPAACDPASF